MNGSIIQYKTNVRDVPNTETLTFQPSPHTHMAELSGPIFYQSDETMKRWEKKLTYVSNTLKSVPRNVERVCLGRSFVRKGYI